MNLLGIIFYVLFVISPVFFWIWYVRQKDSGEPEPKKILFRLFLWGILAAALCVFLESFLDVSLLNNNPEGIFDPFEKGGPVPVDFIVMLGVAGIIEEVVKFIFLKQSVYYSHFFTQIADGVFYGVSLALGFAFIENSAYFLTAIQNEFGIVELFYFSLIRSLAPLIMHITTTGICGLYLGRKKFSVTHSKLLMYKGLAIALAIHVSYNVFYASNLKFGPLLSFAVLISGVVFLLRQLKKPETKVIWKLEYK